MSATVEQRSNPFAADTFRDAFPQPERGGATDKQLAFITSLMTSRELASETRPKFRERLTALFLNEEDRYALTKQQASTLIEYLKEFPVKATDTAADPDPDVPAGRYAVEGNDGVLGFFHVDRPASGRWAGYVFVKRQVGGDTVRMSYALQATVLDAIAADGPKECAIRYGHELGQCAVCGRDLTNEESRTAGIGPVCREKSGW